jgi:tetratricopeptide (TPR) repeat protein
MTHKVKARNGKKDEAAVKKALADTLSDEGKLDEAIVEYRALIALEPGDPCSHFGLGDAYHKKGMLTEALAEVEESIRLRPGWPFYHNKTGKILADMGDAGAAIGEFEKAIALKPDFEDAIANLGRLSGIKGRVRK